MRFSDLHLTTEYAIVIAISANVPRRGYPKLTPAASLTHHIVITITAVSTQYFNDINFYHVS